MSLLKTGAVQVGQSGTASNNFHWRNLLDGLLRLSRGNADAPITDVMRVKADNSVVFPGGVASGVLGAGQTGYDETANRVAGTIYTNTSPAGITVSVTSVYGAATVYLFVNEQPMAVSVGNSSAPYSTAVVMVPRGGTYRFGTAGIPISKWVEQRA